MFSGNKKYKKNVLVMASAGFDSTVLMYENLQKKNYVIPLYIRTCINDDQKNLEIESLRNITTFFAERYGHDFISYDPKIEEINLSYAEKVMLEQPLVWIIGAYLFSQNGDQQIDEIQLGYIMEDQALSFLEEIKNLWNSLNKFQGPHLGNKIPKLTFPIIKYTKYRTMNIIANMIPEIFHLIHFCESPKEDWTNCETCNSCKKALRNDYNSFTNLAESNIENKNLNKFKIQTKGKLFDKFNPQLELFSEDELFECRSIVRARGVDDECSCCEPQDACWPTSM